MSYKPPTTIKFSLILFFFNWFKDLKRIWWPFISITLPNTPIVLSFKSKNKPDLSIWNDVSSRYRNSEGSVRIAVVGKYTKLEDAYKSLSEALIHGGLANKTNVEVTWLESEEFEKTAQTRRLNKYDGILIPGGFGKRGTEGKIKVIKYAREKQIPFLGICLGMQLLVIEL